MSTTNQKYEVTGMTCGHCVASVKEELGELAGVDTVDVELNVGGASVVTVVSDTALDTEQVRAAINEAGYELVTATP